MEKNNFNPVKPIVTIFVPLFASVIVLLIVNRDLAKSKEALQKQSQEFREAINAPDTASVIDWHHDPYLYTEPDSLPPLALIGGLTEKSKINQERLYPFEHLDPYDVQFKVRYLSQYINFISDYNLSSEDIDYIVKYSDLVTNHWEYPFVVTTNNIFATPNEDNSYYKGYNHWTESVEDFLINHWKKNSSKVKEYVDRNYHK